MLIPLTIFIFLLGFIPVFDWCGDMPFDLFVIACANGLNALICTFQVYLSRKRRWLQVLAVFFLLFYLFVSGCVASALPETHDINGNKLDLSSICYF